MKIYIAGKITGDENFKGKFEVLKHYFETLGYAVLNPADLPEGMEPADYMRICLSMIDSADVIYFIKDYVDSKGSQIEIRYAEYIGKTLKFELEEVYPNLLDHDMIYRRNYFYEKKVPEKGNLNKEQIDRYLNSVRGDDAANGKE